MPSAGCRKGGFKMHFSNFYNRSHNKRNVISKSQKYQKYIPGDIIQLPAGSNCYNFGIITLKSVLLGRKMLMCRFISLAMTACLEIEINPMIPVTDCS